MESGRQTFNPDSKSEARPNDPVSSIRKETKMEQKIVQITAGQGPLECKWVVAKVQKLFRTDVAANRYTLTELSLANGERDGTISSVTFLLEGFGLDGFLSNWKGSILWIGQSPYRKNHKRKNWFIGLDVFSPKADFEFDLQDVRFETFRSSGSGGQHVNKVESAVRAIHIPTGLKVEISATPSQRLNKNMALEKLKIELEKLKAKQIAQANHQHWTAHAKLERGNPVRVYEGKKFKLKT